MEHQENNQNNSYHSSPGPNQPGMNPQGQYQQGQNPGGYPQPGMNPQGQYQQGQNPGGYPQLGMNPQGQYQQGQNPGGYPQPGMNPQGQYQQGQNPGGYPQPGMNPQGQYQQGQNPGGYPQPGMNPQGQYQQGQNPGGYPQPGMNPQGQYQQWQNPGGYPQPGYSGMEQGQIPEIQTKKIWNQTTLAMFIMGITVVLFELLSSFIFGRFFPQVTESDWYVWVLTAIVIVGIALPLIYLLTRSIPNSPKGEVVKLKTHQFFGLFFICTAVMYIANFFSVFLLFAISIIKGESFYDLNPLTDLFTSGNFIYGLLYASIAAPIVEELIFRKILLEKLRRYGDIPAILLTAFAFGLFHMNLAQFFYATALGIIFAYVTIRTNTVKYSILLHIMINSVGTLMTPFATKPNMVVSVIIMIWIFSSIAIGVVILALNIRKVRLYRAPWPLAKVSGYFLNPGTILYIILCLVMIVIATVQ